MRYNHCSRHTVRSISSSSLLYVLLLWATNTQIIGQPLLAEHWYHISIPHADIIFKGNIEREAQRVANTLHYLYGPISQTLGVSPPKIPLVLINQQFLSNGSVRLSPRKMTLHTSPPQDYNFIGSNTWLELLLTHEFRHAVQYVQLTRRINRLAYMLGGDMALSTMISYNVPSWLLEGDAINSETVFTQSGRGRIPNFSLLYRTNLLAGRRFSYAKQVFGSLKDPMPRSCYEVGYYLTTHLRRQFGASVIADILYGTTTLPILFPRVFRQKTGQTLLKTYQNVNQELKELWEAQLQGLTLTHAIRLNRRTGTADYADYTHPQRTKDGHVVVLKSGIGVLPRFVEIDTSGKEHTLYCPGDIDKRVGFSIVQDQIVWIEKVPDLVQQNRSYKVIKHYDIRTKRSKTLTRRSRYGSVALSPDATQLVAFESDEAYRHQLVILDAETGQVIRRLPNPDNHFFLTPQWSEDGHQILVVKNVQRQVTLSIINATTGVMQDLLPYSTEHVGCPTMRGQYVLYNSAYSGIDNIYAVDITTRQRYQITSRAYGAYHPTCSADGCWIIFNDFTRDGMDVVRMPFEPKHWTPLERVENRSVHYYAPLEEQEYRKGDLAYIPNHTYPVKRYHAREHWINIHSWLTTRGIGIGSIRWNVSDLQNPTRLLRQIDLNILHANDLLDTTELIVNYLHNFKEAAGAVAARLDYKGIYPLLSAYGALIGSYEDRLSDTQIIGVKAKCPLRWSSGRFKHSIDLSTTGSLYQTPTHKGYTQHYHLYYDRYTQKSLRDIEYPWRQFFSVTYGHGPYQSACPAPYWATTAAFNFPGLVRHHALCLAFHYRYKTTWAWKQVGGLMIPRYTLRTLTGYPCIGQAQYHFPITHPDWTIGNLGYVKRLRGAVSYRHDFFRLQEFTKKYHKEAVVELLADVHLFPLLNMPPCVMSVKYIHLEQKKSRFLFSIKLVALPVP